MKTKYWVFAIVILFVLIGGFFIYENHQSRASALDGLPNYTEDKTPIQVDGYNLDRQPHLGDPNAPVKLIEFGDFKCPVCKNWTLTNFAKLKSDYIDKGKVEFYFINYAFIDRDSLLAAAAGEAVYQQSNTAFWTFYERLYEQQGKETDIWATPAFLKDFAKNEVSGIDLEAYNAAVDAHTYLHQVKEDFKIGGYYGVNGTPTFVVNGKVLRSNAYEDIAAAIAEVTP